MKGLLADVYDERVANAYDIVTDTSFAISSFLAPILGFVIIKESKRYVLNGGAD